MKKIAQVRKLGFHICSSYFAQVYEISYTDGHSAVAYGPPMYAKNHPKEYDLLNIASIAVDALEVIADKIDKKWKRDMLQEGSDG